MRCFTVCVVFLTLFAAVTAMSPERATASNRNDFIEWALRQGDTCDQRWDRLTETFVVEGVQPGGKVAAGRSYTGDPAYTGGTSKNRGTWSVSGSGFIHKGNLEFMPLSTRERSGATRGGMFALKNPASASLGVPHSLRRPTKSSIERRSFLRGQKDFVRPYLKRMGRQSATGRRRGGFTRPYTRPDRPKKFKW